MSFKIKKCPKCNSYYLSDICKKCNIKNIDAHYKFIGLKEEKEEEE